MLPFGAQLHCVCTYGLLIIKLSKTWEQQGPQQSPGALDKDAGLLCKFVNFVDKTQLSIHKMLAGVLQEKLSTEWSQVSSYNLQRLELACISKDNFDQQGEGGVLHTVRLATVHNLGQPIALLPCCYAARQQDQH